jgi:hypothetical protein
LQREPVAFGAERDALADFEVGHVAYALQQFVFVFERIGGDEFGLPQRRAFLCCSDCAAARQQEQKECLFHVGLVCLSVCFVLFRFGRVRAKIQKICSYPVKSLQSWAVNLKRI